MADTPPVSSSDASSPPLSAADQARIRKERREAKIKAGGSARLNRITGLGGGVQRDPIPQPPASSPSPKPPTAASSTDDPEEVDISQHFYQPGSMPRSRMQPSQSELNDAQLRQMMLGFDNRSNPAIPPSSAQANPFSGFTGGIPPGLDAMGMGGPGGAGMEEDPMMKMLQQMMGGVPGEGPGGMPSFPAGMQNPFAPSEQATGTENPYAYLWRIVHAVFALALGFYIAFTTPFTGTKFEREMSGLSGSVGENGLASRSVRFFYIFATVEVLLQTSRFFLEKGRVQQGGIMGMVTGFLPEPYKGYFVLLSRYSRIWTTVSGDAMVCMFVLGVCAWLRAA